MNPLTYYGKVKDGKISLPKKMRADIMHCFEGKAIEVVVRRKRKRRSTLQNSYYWGVVLPIITNALFDFDPENGKDSGITHQWLKERYLPKVLDVVPSVNLPNGEIVKGIYTTTKITTSQFMDYLMFVIQWAAEFGIIVPDPDTDYWKEQELIDIDKK